MNIIEAYKELRNVAPEYLFCVSDVLEQVDHITLTSYIRYIKIKDKSVEIQFLLGNENIWNFFARNPIKIKIQSLNKNGVAVSSAIYYLYEGKLKHNYFSHECSNKPATATFTSKYEVETEIIEML